MQAEVRKSEKNSVGEWEQNYGCITQHMPRINESQNELVKVQVHELVYIASRIAYTTE